MHPGPETFASISTTLGKHYTATFQQHGPTSAGADWGMEQSRVELRYRKMLEVIPQTCEHRATLLDVGCGYGGLLQYIRSREDRNGKNLEYSGIDVSEPMIAWARKNLADATFLGGDVLSPEFSSSYDYVVCNGILTQKLDTPGRDMDAFAHELIRKMFSLCRLGIAFNVMTTKVNHFANNLYYRNPAEMLAWCLSEITPLAKLDHSYPLYEYTVYLYRQPVA